MEDTRDLRDPQRIGNLLEMTKKTMLYRPATERADKILSMPGLPNYPQDESLSTYTARVYQAELKERADNGDIYARSYLSGDRGDDPSGN